MDTKTFSAIQEGLHCEDCNQLTLVLLMSAYRRVYLCFHCDAFRWIPRRATASTTRR